MREVSGLQRKRVRDANVMICHGDCTVNVRHIRVSCGPGRPRTNAPRETMFLLTNLPASWSPTRLGKLYRCRWGIETMFRELKVTLNGEPLISRSLEGVIQEIDARCLHLTIAAILDMATRYAHSRSSRHGSATCHTNRSTIYTLIALVLLANFDPHVLQQCQTAIEQAAARAQKVRPGRHAPRKPKMFKSHAKLHRA